MPLLFTPNIVFTSFIKIDGRIHEFNFRKKNDAIFEAVARTHRAVVVQEGFAFAGVGAEIVSRIQESCFDLLDALSFGGSSLALAL